MAIPVHFKQSVDQMHSWKVVVTQGESINHINDSLIQLILSQMLEFINNQITAIGAEDIFNKHYQFYHEQELNFVDLTYIWIKSSVEDYDFIMSNFRRFLNITLPARMAKGDHLDNNKKQQIIVEKFMQSFPDGEIVVYQKGKFEIMTIDQICEILPHNKYVIIDQNLDTPTRYYEDRYCNDRFSQDIENFTPYQRQQYIDHWRLLGLKEEVGIKTFLNSRLTVLRTIKQRYRELQVNNPAELAQLEKNCESLDQFQNVANIDWTRYKSLVEFYNQYLIFKNMFETMGNIPSMELNNKFKELLGNPRHQKVLMDCDKIINHLKTQQDKSC